MEDPSTEIYDTGELVARWHTIVEAYVAEELAESVRRLTELSSARDERTWPDPIALARHLAHALVEATGARGVASSVDICGESPARASARRGFPADPATTARPWWRGPPSKCASSSEDENPGRLGSSYG